MYCPICANCNQTSTVTSYSTHPGFFCSRGHQFTMQDYVRSHWESVIPEVVRGIREDRDACDDGPITIIGPA